MDKKKDGFNNEKLMVLPQDIVSSASQHALVKNLYITDIGFFPHAQYHYRERKEGCNKLDLTDLTVSEIAQKLGYNDQYYFLLLTFCRI